MKAFEVGQLVVVVGGPEFGIGLVGLVMSEPYRLGWVVDPRSTWFGMAPGTLIQDLYVRDISERLAEHTAGALHIAYPPEFLEPLLDDGTQKGEWTEFIRSLCGAKQTEDA